MDSDGSIRGLELSGFKEETIQDVVYYIMKPGNLNKPWLTVLVNILTRTIRWAYLNNQISYHSFSYNKLLITMNDWMNDWMNYM